MYLEYLIKRAKEGSPEAIEELIAREEKHMEGRKAAARRYKARNYRNFLNDLQRLDLNSHLTANEIAYCLNRMFDRPIYSNQKVASMLYRIYYGYHCYKTFEEENMKMVFVDFEELITKIQLTESLDDKIRWSF